MVPSSKKSIRKPPSRHHCDHLLIGAIAEYESGSRRYRGRVQYRYPAPARLQQGAGICTVETVGAARLSAVVFVARPHSIVASLSGLHRWCKSKICRKRRTSWAPTQGAAGRRPSLRPLEDRSGLAQVSVRCRKCPFSARRRHPATALAQADPYTVDDLANTFLKRSSSHGNLDSNLNRFKSCISLGLDLRKPGKGISRECYPAAASGG